MFKRQNAGALNAPLRTLHSKLKFLFFQKARKGRTSISAMQAIIRNFLYYFS
jgi:hypothetical protein